MSRISIFTGHFGSGKTEIAINYGIKKAKEGKKVMLVDIDIVTPYFCSRDFSEQLQSEYGIKVISSNPNLRNAELMVVSSEVLAAFHDKSYEVIFDVGGDESGARILSTYKEYFDKELYDMYFVFNALRPLTGNNSYIMDYLMIIERTSRLKVTYIISNTNLLEYTEKKHILQGDKEAVALSEKLKIPYKYVVCENGMDKDLVNEVHGEVFPIRLFLNKI